MSKSRAVALTFFFSFGLAACGAPESGSQSEPSGQIDSAAADPDCNLVLGWDPWEPYQYRDVEGVLRGLDIELAGAIITNAGCELSFEEGRWATLLRRLQSGGVDVLTGATRTPARDSFALFSAPYRSEDFKLYIRKGESEKQAGTTLEALLETGFRVGITEQYVYGDVISSLQESPRYAEQFVGATVGELNYARLLDHNIDGFLEDPFVAARAFRNRTLSDEIEAHPLNLHSSDVNLMFSRQTVSADIVRRIDQSLAEIRADGRYQAIIDKYLR